MKWKLAVVVFFLGIVLGFSLGLYINQPPDQQGNYTLVLDSNYKDIALSLINSANSSIILAVYSAKYYPDYPNPLLDALCQAKSRGVKVEVVLDDELDYNKETLAYLKSCGVDAKLDSPKTRLHAKFLVVDGKLVLLGSTNWSYSSLNLNHEVDVLISDSGIARQLKNYFYNLAS